MSDEAETVARAMVTSRHGAGSPVTAADLRLAREWIAAADALIALRIAGQCSLQRLAVTQYTNGYQGQPQPLRNATSKT